MSAPALTITGNIQTIFGVSDTGGTVRFQLCNYGNNIPRIPGTGFIVATNVAAPVVSGSWSTPIWNNTTDITPSGTYYVVWYVSDSGVTTAQVPYILSGSGTVDLSTLTPMVSIPVVPMSPVIYANPTSAQTISGYPLSLAAGLQLPTGQGVSWNADTGISRLGVASLAIGNGTAGNMSGILQLTSIVSVNGGGNKGVYTTGTSDYLLSLYTDNKTYIGPSVDRNNANTGETVIYRSGTGNTGNGTLTVNGAASPAAAFTFGGNIQLAGTSNLVQFWSGSSFDTGLSRGAAGQVNVGNGNPGDVTGTLWCNGITSFGAINTPTYQVSASSGVIKFYSGGSYDTGLSRTAAGTVAVGNGTTGDYSGTLKCGTVNANTLAPISSALNISVGSPGTINWNSDTGLSRGGSGNIYVGNGTFADSSGTLTASSVIATILNVGSTSGVVKFWGGSSYDVGLSRGAAGNVYVGNGTAGNMGGTLVANQVSANTGCITNLQIQTASGAVQFYGGSSYDTGLSRGAARSVYVGNGTAQDQSGFLTANTLYANWFRMPVSNGAFTFWGTSSYDTGISRGAAGQINIGNGSAGDYSGQLYASTEVLMGSYLALNTATVTKWWGTSSYDTGLSRTAAGQVAVGNGTAGDSTGALYANNLNASSYVNTSNLFMTSSISVAKFWSGSSYDTGISRLAAKCIVVGNGTPGDNTGTIVATNAQILSAEAFGTTGDVGFSRTAAGTVAVGNGTAQDTTGNLQLNLITKYGGVATVANGVGAIVAKADATAQAANIGTTTLYTVPAGGEGMYRVSAYVVVTQAATSSSTMPAVDFTWTDVDSGVSSSVWVTATGTNNYLGYNSQLASPQPAYAIINAKDSTTIQYSTASYASVGATAMQYAVHIKLQFLGN